MLVLDSNLKNLPNNKIFLKQVIFIGVVGSIVGAILLVATPEVNFRHALPCLNGGATLLFVLAPWLKKQRSHNHAPKFFFPLFLFACGIYGGYFGGGLGLLMLAVFGLTTMQNVQEQNAVKLLTASIVNLVALLLFVFTSLIVWRAALPAGAGALIGGWAGSNYFSHITEHKVRIFVIAIGTVTTILLFLKLY